MTKSEINAKFGVNCIYHDTDSIMCDNKKQIVNTQKGATKMTRRISYEHLMKLREELKTTYRTGQGRQDVFNALELAADYIDLLEARQEFLIRAILKFSKGDDEE